jgi:macrolide transport system ATP-binding/permease protein
MSWLSRLRRMLQRDRLGKDLDEELRSHIEMRATDNMAAGMTPEEAGYDARRRFGNVTLLNEDTRAMDLIGWLDTAARDVRYAVRLLRKNPGFTAASVLTLALGVIGTTLVLTAYDAIALRTLAVRDTKSLAVLKRELRKGGVSAAFSEREYRNFSEHNPVFEGTIAETGYDTVLAQLPDAGQKNLVEPRQVIIKLVSENYFSVLGVNAIAGRMFTEQEHGGAELVAILSYSSWQRRFRGDPEVLGRSVLLNGTPITIIGIAPSDFIGTGLPPVPPDLWIPLPMQTRVEPGRDWAHYADELRLRVVGRLRPNVSARQARATLTAMAQRFETDRGLEQVTSAVETDPPVYFIERGNPQFQSLAALLMVSFGMVLLIACANLANFFLARATARRKEMAVRRALGASRVGLMRQLLTEGILIGLAAGAITLITSPLLCDFIWREIQSRIVFRFSDLYVFTFRFSPDSWVLAWTMVVSIAAGILFSVMGATHCTKADSHEALQGHVAQWRSNRGKLRVSARDVLIAAQVVFSVVLLVNAGLVARGMARGQKVFPGFDTGQVINIEFGDIENAGIDRAHTAALREQLARRLSALPEVAGVAFADHVPLLGAGTTTVTEPGKVGERAFDNQISPGFFSVFGISIVRGRDFTAADAAQRASVVIITESTGQHLWPGEDALGKIIQVGDTQTPAQVIGVVQDTRTVVLGRVEPLYLYLPAAADTPIGDVFVRTTGIGQTSMGLVLNATTAIDSKLASLASMHVMDDTLWFQRLPSTIATMFATSVGSLGLFLATVGIYGTIVYAVAQRTREIGIRIALGAQAMSILRLVLLRMMRLVGVATCIGLALATALSHALTVLPFGMGSLLLFGVSLWDPLVFATVVVFLAVIALSAAYLPARRATEVDPMVALRYE